MNLTRLAFCTAALGVLFASAADARPVVTLVVGEATVDGDTVVINGEATGIPDGTMLMATIGFKHLRGFEQIGTTKDDAFAIKVGDGTKRLLPGSYVVKVTFNARTQTRSVSRKLNGFSVTAGEGTFTVGTPEEERTERASVQSVYEACLVRLQTVNDKVHRAGTALMRKAGAEALNAGGETPPDRQTEILAEWAQNIELIGQTVPPIREELESFRDTSVVGYYPQVDTMVGEIGVNLERKGDSMTVLIYKKMGAQIPGHVKARGRFSLSTINRTLPRLGASAYQALGLEVKWGGRRKPIERAPRVPQGNTFRSEESKFEITKPDAGWIFDTRQSSAARKVRLRVLRRELQRSLVSGVEVRAHEGATNGVGLAKFDENWARASWPGFSLKGMKSLEIDDDSLPKGKRLGQEVRFTFMAGTKTFRAIQYSLFGHESNLTYTVISFATEDIYDEWEKTFETINASFKVFDTK
jgi:hypothetical protein